MNKIMKSIKPRSLSGFTFVFLLSLYLILLSASAAVACGGSIPYCTSIENSCIADKNAAEAGCELNCDYSFDTVPCLESNCSSWFPIGSGKCSNSDFLPPCLIDNDCTVINSSGTCNLTTSCNGDTACEACVAAAECPNKLSGCKNSCQTNPAYSTQPCQDQYNECIKSCPTTTVITAAIPPQGGYIVPSGTVTIPKGTQDAPGSVTFSMYPYACYHFSKVVLTNSSDPSTSMTLYNDPQTIWDVGGTIYFDAYFTSYSYTVSGETTDGGTITPASTTVNCGESATFTMIPNAGYTLVDLVLDPKTNPAHLPLPSLVNGIYTYTLANIRANHTLRAVFVWSLTVSKSGVGSGTVTSDINGFNNTGINCNGGCSTASAEYPGGATVTLTATPDTNTPDTMVFVGWSGDVCSGSTNTTCTFTMNSDVKVTANFTKQFTLTSSAGPGGSVSPSTTITCLYGSIPPFTITPDPGNDVFQLLVDGNYETGGNLISYKPYCDSNHTIYVTFSSDINASTSNRDGNLGGTISPSGAHVTVPCGTDQAFTMTPFDHSHIQDVQVDGASVGVVSSYTFTNVLAPHTIYAVFSGDTNTVTASAGPGGSISPSGFVAVPYGTKQSFTITPNTGDTIFDVQVDGVSVGAVSSYAFDVTAPHAISATFSTTISASTSYTGGGQPNGTISPSGTVTVPCGTDQSFAITPSGLSHIQDVQVDGVSVGAVSSYPFANVTTPHTISAIFAANTFTITATAGSGGTITPGGDVAVTAGTVQAFAITPSTGYYLVDVVVDGVSKGAIGGYTFNSVTANHTISATFATIVITATAGAGGQISPSGIIDMLPGASQTFTITPDAGNSVLNVLVDGVSAGAVTTYNFSKVAPPSHTISATFSTTISASTSYTGGGQPNGTISPSGTVTVPCGTDQSFAITPSGLSHIQDVQVDGVSVGAVSSYPFANVTTPHTISAIFAANTYTIVAAAGTGGSISPSGSVSVTAGTNQSFTIKPTAGYYIADVLVDGISKGAITSYAFNSVTASHTISVSFTPTITASSSSGGTISPSGNKGVVSVTYGADQAFTMTPNSGYHISDVLVDGVTVGAVDTYTFTAVTAPHTISVNFANTYTITATAGSGGTITPSGNVSVSPGQSRTFSISHNTGYQILDVVVDGTSVGAVGSYTFTNVNANHTIRATFQ